MVGVSNLVFMYMLKNICWPCITCVHTEKSFRNLIKSTWNQIVFTMHRLIWNQTGVRFVPNQSVHGKYNLISVWYNTIWKIFLLHNNCDRPAILRPPLLLKPFPNIALLLEGPATFALQVSTFASTCRTLAQSRPAIGWWKVNKPCYWLAGFVYLPPTPIVGLLGTRFLHVERHYMTISIDHSNQFCSICHSISLINGYIMSAVYTNQWVRSIGNCKSKPKMISHTISNLHCTTIYRWYCFGKINEAHFLPAFHLAW